MNRIKVLIRWLQFFGWTGLWIWSAITDDPNQPWRVMFSIACFINAFDRAFESKPPKEEV